MRFLSSLRSAFTLYFTLAAMVPLAVVGYLGDQYLLRQHLGQLGQELNLHTLDIDREIQRLLQQMQRDLLLARDLCEQRGAAANGNLDALLANIVRNSPEMLSIYLLDEEKRVRHLGLAEKLAGREDDYRGLDLSAQELFAGSSDGDRSQAADGRWSEVFVSFATGDPAISLALPFGSRTLLGTLSLERLGDTLVKRINHRDGLEFSIIDHHGVLVAHSNPALVRQRTNVTMLHPEVHEAIVNGRELAMQFHEDGSLLESLRVISFPHWVVYAGLQREIAMQPMQQARVLMLKIVAGSILLCLTLAFWLSWRISRPLLRLRDTAGAVACGDYDGTSALQGWRFREIDDLAASLRSMAATIRARELTLRESEGRFRSLVEGMGEGMLIVDQDGQVVECNDAASRIVGVSRPELLGSGTLPGRWPLVREDGSICPDAENPFRIMLNEGVAVNNRIVGLKRPDGSEVWLLINSRPVFGPAGEAVKASVTFADVTGLKLTEESLRVSKLRFQDLYQQFSALLEGITDRIILLSPDWRVIWTNQDFAVAGKRAEAVPAAGRCCYEAIFGRLAPCHGCPAQETFATAEPAFGEVQGDHGRVYHLKTFPIFGAGGEVRNVVMIAEDVTEKRESERQRIRAGQLAALGELAAGVAHEINNPISGVINYAQLIVNRTDGQSREHELAQRIIKEGDRIATIVHELLTFAREESTEFEVVSLKEALNEALALCGSQLRREGVDLHVDLPHELPRVKSRSHQVQQLFLNLISNARHALGEKFPEPHPDKRLLISGRSVEIDGRPGVQLKVRDHGVGIPATLLERVMNPFVTTKPAGVGTGLGLSICFDIAKKHGGMLSIDSRQGEWTEVTVDLPAITAG